MQPTVIVDVVDEAGQIRSGVFEGLVGHRVDRLDLQCLDEAFGLRVVVGVAAPPHRADQAVPGQELAVGAGGILRSSIRAVDAAWGGFLPSIAACRAAMVSLASMARPMAYPITRRDQASRITAR